MTHDKSAEEEENHDALEKAIRECQKIADLPEGTMYGPGEVRALKGAVRALGVSMVTMGDEVRKLRTTVKDLESRVSTGEKGKWATIPVDSGMT